MRPSVFICLFFVGLCSVVLAEHPSVCPFGYDQVDRKCFKILNLSFTFFEAVTACDVIDGKLIEVSSNEDQTRVSSYLEHKKPLSNNLWLGATNLQGKWMYLSSKNQNVMDSWNSWTPGFPKAATMEDPNNCGVLSQSSGWNWQNAPCSYHQGALCSVTLRDDLDNTIVG